MIRRTSLIAQVVLVGAVAVLTFPSASSAFRGVGISPGEWRLYALA